MKVQRCDIFQYAKRCNVNNKSGLLELSRGIRQCTRIVKSEYYLKINSSITFLYNEESQCDANWVSTFILNLVYQKVISSSKVVKTTCIMSHNSVLSLPRLVQVQRNALG